MNDLIAQSRRNIRRMHAEIARRERRAEQAIKLLFVLASAFLFLTIIGYPMN